MVHEVNGKFDPKWLSPLKGPNLDGLSEPKTFKGSFPNGPFEYTTPRMVETERSPMGRDTLRETDLQPLGHAHLTDV